MEQGKPKKSGERLRLFGPSKTPLKYNSASTRATSLQGFMGGAELDEYFCKADKNYSDMAENLETKFKSGVNRTDIPTRYGPAKVTRKLMNFTLENSDNIKTWWRKKGEPVK